MKRLAALGALVGVLLLPSFAAAQNPSMTVSANVSNNCVINTTPLSFAAQYDPVTANATAPLDGSGSIVLACTKGFTPVIGISLGNNLSGGKRHMSGSGTATGEQLQYEIYSDSGRSAVWNNTTSKYSAPKVTSKNAVTHQVYGRIPGNQDVNAGPYQDTVTASVDF
jgi:spore coat protein U-like protein